MACAWKRAVGDAIDAATAQLCEDALEEEILAELSAQALVKMQTLKIRSTLRSDPYGELEAVLARRLAARVRVVSFEKVRTRHESRVSSVLELRSATDGAGGRALRVEYEAAAGALRYSARLDARTPERAPTTVLAASMCCQEPRQPRVRLRPAGCRNLSNALGTRLNGEQCLFFLLSLLPTFDNEYELDETILAALGLLDDADGES